VGSRQPEQRGRRLMGAKDSGVTRTIASGSMPEKMSVTHGAERLLLPC
jgi:hypothetical protein